MAFSLGSHDLIFRHSQFVLTLEDTKFHAHTKQGKASYASF
jgi:hypothetical protein